MNRRRYLTLLGIGMGMFAGCGSDNRKYQAPLLDEPRNLRLWNRYERARTLDIEVHQVAPLRPGRGDPGLEILYEDQIELQAESSRTISDVIKRAESVHTHVEVEAKTTDRYGGAFVLPVNEAIGDLNLGITNAADIETFVTFHRMSHPISRSPSPQTKMTNSTATESGTCIAKSVAYDDEKEGRVTFAVRMKNSTTGPRNGVLRIFHQSCRCQGTGPRCSTCQSFAFQGAYKLAPGEVTTREITQWLTSEIDRYKISFLVLKEGIESSLTAQDYAGRDALIGIEKGAKDRVDESVYTETGNMATLQKDFYVCPGSTHEMSAIIRPSDQPDATITVDLST